MNEENNYGTGTPVLDDIEYTAPTQRKGGPTGVSAPVLDDMDAYVPPTTQKKGAPTGVSAPVLDDGAEPYIPEKKEVKVMTDEDVIATFTPEQLETFNKFPEANKRSVIDKLREQMGAVAPKEEISAPVLDDEVSYTAPPKQEKPAEPVPSEPIKAPVLDEAPETPAYKPKFVDEDLERAKREGAKQAVSSQLESEPKNSKESLKNLLALKEEIRRDQAAKGFKICIVLGIVGVIAAVAFFLLYSGSLGLTYKDGLDGIAVKLKDASLYIAVAMGVSSLTLMTGVGFLKSLATLIYLLSSIAQIFPGILMISQHNGSLPLIILLYAVSLAASVVVFLFMTGSEAVGLYFNKDLRN